MDEELTSQLKRVLAAVELLLPRPVPPLDWGTVSAANWRRHAMAGYLEALPAPDTLPLENLLGINTQKATVEGNTRQFLAGYPANNILLWGTRGTGKSSLVRALLQRYAPEGLRFIQVDKEDLAQLPAITDAVKHEPYRFILFADDVSFELGETSYKVLKSALDGAVYALPANVLIYVTSNRRHLLPEYESDNRGAMLVNNEIHHGEAVEEKISLSGRFGLWVGFHPFSQDQFLEVVQQWVARLCLKNNVDPVWTSDISDAAIDWSRMKADRSGRIALQFATNWVGQYLLHTNSTK